MKSLILILATLGFASAHASDAGFRFNGTACVNSQGQSGLNPGFFGQCGDLQHIVISGLPLDGTDFSGSVFDGSDFSTTSFQGAKFNGASLKGTNLTGTNLMNAQIHGANLQNAILTNAKLANADIQNSDFTKANFSGVALSLMDLSGNKLVGVNFSGSALDGVNLANADLSSSLFVGANLQGATLDGAKLNSANFATADLTKGSLKGATGTNVGFSGSLLRQAALDAVDFAVCNFRGAQMDNSTMSKASFEASDMRSAVLQGADVADANFRGVRINHSTVLPITQDQAISMGMYFDASGNLLLIADAGDAGLVNFVASLQQLGVSVTISSEQFTQFNGDLDLSDYTAIFLSNVAAYDSELPAAGQTAIVNFVNNGGTIITPMSINYTYYYDGYLQGFKDFYLMNYGGSNLSISGAQTINDPSNPIFNGVAATDFQGEVYNQSTLVSFATNAPKVLMSYGNDPLVVSRQVGTGQEIDLAFCPPNQQSCLTNPKFAKLVSNMVNVAQTAQVKARKH